MSLVQAYIYNDFIVVGGENRAVINNTIVDDYKKVFKLNECTIIGFTGSIAGNACLFSDYINSNLSLTELCKNSTYQDIVEHLIDTYYENFDFINSKGIYSIVCGWDGSKMTGKAFFAHNINKPLDGIIDITPLNKKYLRLVNCGLDRHYNLANEFISRLETCNIPTVKNIFKNVINEGISFDYTINNILTFEEIKK